MVLLPLSRYTIDPLVDHAGDIDIQKMVFMGQFLSLRNAIVAVVVVNDKHSYHHLYIQYRHHTLDQGREV